MAEAPLDIRAFDKALHDRGAFSCGVEAMDRWFRQSISDRIRANRLRVWCATRGGKAVLGFYALQAHSVRCDEAGALQTRLDRQEIPAIYLNALAVDLRSQGQGLGGVLLADAVVRSIGIAEQIGCAALVLDVLRDAHFEQRRAFYLAHGFRPLSEVRPERMYLAISDAVASL